MIKNGHTIAVYAIGMCIREDNPDPKNIKGDNSREMVICVEQGIVYDLTHSSSYLKSPYIQKADVFWVTLPLLLSTVCIYVFVCIYYV